MNIVKITLCCSLSFLLFATVPFYAGTTVTVENELLEACRAYDLASVKEIIKMTGVDVNAGDEYGNTPLLIAAQLRNLYLVDELLSLQKSDGSFAVNVNQSNIDGTTPLLAACQNSNGSIVDSLIKVAGIDVNLADKDGNTPLLVVCRTNYASRNLSIIDVLLENGASNRANNQGETPLELTKDTLEYGMLEFYLVGEVQASRWCSPLSAEECKYPRESDLERCREAKVGIPFHE